MKQKMTLGVDFGDVIINHRSTDPLDKTLHEERYSTIPANVDAFDSLKILNVYFGREVYLVSKCTEWAEAKILKWLDDNQFYEKTGIDRTHVHFVRERHEKDAVCQKLGITHFIDDRLEVLSHMIASTPHLYLYQPRVDEVEKFKEFLPRVTIVVSWKDALEKIITK